MTGTPASIVRDTVQVRSCEVFAARGRIARAASPASPGGKVTEKVSVRSLSTLPVWSRTTSASTRAPNVSAGLRRPVTTSMSTAEQPASAASSSSTGENPSSALLPNRSCTPRGLRARYTPSSSRSRVTQRWSSLIR